MFRKTVLPNGIRVLTESLESFRSACLGVWVGVGSRDESPDQAGVSHLVEHMIFKGTARRDALQIAKDLDALGAMSNAFTSREQTCFHAKVMDAHLAEVVELLTDICLNSVFAPEELVKEQEVVRQEIKMVEDSPEDLVHDLMPEVLWPDHPLGRSILGREETVSGQTQDSLKSFLESAYRPESMLLTAAGRLDHEELLKLVEPTFGRLADGRPGTARLEPSPRAGEVIREKPLEQVNLCLGFAGVSARSPERFPAAVLNTLLGGSMSSRLFQEVREKRGLAYSVYSYLASYSDVGLLGVYLGVEPRRLREALKVVLEVSAEFGRNGLPDDELKKAKEHLKGSIFLAAESTDNRMNRLAKNEFHFGRHLTAEEIAAEIDAVTAEAVAGLARRILDPKLMALVALGPEVEKNLGSGWYRG